MTQIFWFGYILKSVINLLVTDWDLKKKKLIRNSNN